MTTFAVNHRLRTPNSDFREDVSFLISKQIAVPVEEEQLKLAAAIISSLPFHEIH